MSLEFQHHPLFYFNFELDQIVRNGFVKWAVYSREANGDDSTGVPDPDPVKVIDLMGAIQGDYTLQLTGTGTGTYNLDIRAYDQNDNPSPASFLKMPVQVGQVITYTIPFDPAGSTPLFVRGGFDGGGQRPRDVKQVPDLCHSHGRQDCADRWCHKLRAYRLLCAKGDQQFIHCDVERNGCVSPVSSSAGYARAREG